MLRGLELGIDTGDARRHASVGEHEDMTGLPTDRAEDDG
jgi:hypothetical protein